MNYLPLCLLCVLLPVSGVASAGLAVNKTSATPTNSTSKTYDAKGKLLQKTDDQGRRYNAKGQYQGKTITDGKHYDAKGKLLQKTDERGRIYDAKGKYQGKVKPLSPVKCEKRDAKGKLLEVKKTDDPAR